MTPLKMIILLVLFVTLAGLFGGLMKAVKDKDEGKKKSIGISFGVIGFVFMFVYAVFP